MAIASGTIWEIRTTGATGNTGGAGFNTANANGLTDLTCDTNTGNTDSPVASSASYNFMAGDVGAWLYVVSGTSFVPGWYQIASVASNKATLTASVGSAMLRDTSFNPHKYYTNTSAGFATVGTPTGGTFLIDYSQQASAQATNTDITCTAASTTVSSSSAPFTRMMVGNIIHFTALTGTGAITGWYEIVSYTSTSSVVLDRTPTNGVNNITAGTFFVGGAGRLNGLEDAFLEMIQSENYVWIKNGTYTISGSFNVASTNSTGALPSNIIGYNSERGDSCTLTNRPVIAAGANAATFGQYQNLFNLSFTGTGSTLSTAGTGSRVHNCKFLNTSTTANRIAFSINNGTISVTNSEMVSQNGIGISSTASGLSRIFGCYIHDSVTGISASILVPSVVFCIFEACSTDAINSSVASNPMLVANCLFYGVEGNIGTGFNGSNSASVAARLYNNIFYGLTTGVTVSTTEQKSNSGFNNNFYNNTTDCTRYSKDVTDLALDPQFTSAVQITGTTGTTSGSVLTQSGGDFSTVTDNVDFLRVTSGTGTTLGCYLITSHTSTTVTVNNTLGTGATADKVYFIGTGHNFAIGTNLKAQGFPGLFPAEDTTGYIDIGPAQRQEAGGSAATVSYTFVS